MSLVRCACAALTIARKDLLLLARDRMALFWVFAFPLLLALFMGAVLKAGLEHDVAPLSVMWVDDSGGHAALLYLAVKAQGADLQLASLADAQKRVRKAEAAALVHVPADFPFGGRPIELIRDPSRPIEARLVEHWLRMAASAPREPSKLRIRTSDVNGARLPSDAASLVLPAMLLWGLLGCSATFAVSIVSERSTGTLVRLRAAPLPRGAILGGKALACFLAGMLSASVLTTVALVASTVSIASPAKWALVLFAISLCFTGITMLLGTLGRTEQSVAGAGWAVLLVLAMLGGAMVPLAFLPEWLGSASRLSPVRWSVLALEGVLVRDFSFHELSTSLAALFATGASTLALGGYALSRQRA